MTSGQEETYMQLICSHLRRASQLWPFSSFTSHLVFLEHLQVSHLGALSLDAARQMLSSSPSSHLRLSLPPSGPRQSPPPQRGLGPPFTQGTDASCSVPGTLHLHSAAAPITGCISTVLITVPFLNNRLLKEFLAAPGSLPL